MHAVATGALRQRIDELVVAHGADAGLGVGCNVGREQVAERRLDRETTGKLVAAARQRVTAAAIARDREIAPARNLTVVLQVHTLCGGAARRDGRGERDGDEGVLVTHAPAAPGS